MHFQLLTLTRKYLFLGAFVPLTKEGNIVVDGVLASCYPSSNYDLVHIVMVPIQSIPENIEWLFGKENGFSVYARIWEDIGSWVLPFWATEPTF